MPGQGNATLLKVRESMVTGAFGVICLVSLPMSRPAMFYLGRAFATGIGRGYNVIISRSVNDAVIGVTCGGCAGDGGVRSAVGRGAFYVVISRAGNG